MVRVALDDDGNDRVVNVLVGEEAEDIRLTHNVDGQPLVCDEHMDRLDPDNPTAQRAAHEAGDRQWPDADTWEGGPDALRFPRPVRPGRPRRRRRRRRPRTPRPSQLTSHPHHLTRTPRSNQSATP